MLVASKVLDLPVFSPIDWDAWWEIWKKNAQPIYKRLNNHNESPILHTNYSWLGFDIYRPENYVPDTAIYPAEYVDCSSVFPHLREYMASLPITEFGAIKIVDSQRTFMPHTDSTTGMQIRSLLYDENVRPTFYYYHNRQKKYQSLPSTSNTWIYRDAVIKHGSDYIGKRKFLVLISGEIDLDKAEALFQNPKYDEYSVKYEL